MVAQLTPALFSQYLQVMRDHGVMDAQIHMEGVALTVRLGPQGDLHVGQDPTPGGWRSPERLDDPDLFDPGPRTVSEVP